ncbi:MAG: hypothetical protein AB7O43_11845 [Hyphomicrobiaceae bacterium]
MSYQNLIRLQDTAQIVFLLCLIGGLIFVLVGLVRPRWVGYSKRLWVVFSTLGIWILGLVIFGGAVGYTHSQPNGPHAFQSYMDGMLAQQCIKTPDRSGCDALKKKCAEGDSTHPSCRILAGEDPNKFYRTTTSR